MTEDLDNKILEEIQRLNLTSVEAKKVLKGLQGVNKKKYTRKKLKGNSNTSKFGILGDLHIGHQDYRPDVLRDAAEYWSKTGIDFILTTGDSIEGMSNREGHVFELTHLGVSAQLDFFSKEMQVLKDWNVYAIEAQNSHGGWAHNKGNQGINIGEELERRASNYVFLGYDEQDVMVDNIAIRLRHPGGGTAYALSYKMQKAVESISGGDKPNVLVDGHFHKFFYMFYRNIHCISAGALQDQSPFMKKIGTPSHVGFTTVSMEYNKEGIVRLSPEWTAYYD
jgi:hypothetical protein